MINIIVPCTPNYSKQNVINTVNKRIDILSQFVILYNSIKENWHFDYRINLFFNNKMPFNDYDLNKLSKLDIDVFAINPDHQRNPYMLRCNALTHKIKKTGTHRLLLDCDTIALKEPIFDLTCDWQAMFANSVIEKKFYNYINTKFKYNLDLENKTKGPLFKKYIDSMDHTTFFPHFNGGAFLIKEDYCQEFKFYTSPSYEISYDSKVPHSIRHIGVQYGASFALAKMSNNWKPFPAGFNYLAKEYNIDKFGKDRISLLHYCGTGGYSVADRYFKDFINKYKDQK